ncbi:MAG: RdgB/HAM1 family non-canonical purine NTP pyrophosphatase [Weeksellaceae bacterium]|nr:RdgB/HAM1 family non-canonical purine NTP pyrophosphatase [Weeksellaceae bacterium]
MSEKVIVVATHNQHKAEEIAQIMPDIEWKTLSDIGYDQEIEENGDSFAENAAIKVAAIREFYTGKIIADDSGLVVPALGGAPGIYSARYAGTGVSKDNISKLLQELKGVEDRSAYFVCAIAYWDGTAMQSVEGRVYGKILHSIQGEKGFGYDPVFEPEGYNISFAEMSAEEKNSISHRENALKKLRKIIENTK